MYHMINYSQFDWLLFKHIKRHEFKPGVGFVYGSSERLSSVYSSICHQINTTVLESIKFNPVSCSSINNIKFPGILAKRPSKHACSIFNLSGADMTINRKACAATCAVERTGASRREKYFYHIGKKSGWYS